jgi:hypothetical protein
MIIITITTMTIKIPKGLIVYYRFRNFLTKELNKMKDINQSYKINNLHK